MISSTFNGKVVIVTGASSGIGEALSREFARMGSKVVLAARNETRLKAIERELTDHGYQAFVCRTDVSIKEDCKRLINTALKKYGSIDILVNNAGVSMKALFHRTELPVLERLMNVNFWGTVYCTRFALPHLLKSCGSLVSVSSVAGFHGLPGRAGYSASKFAIHGLMETIRIENLKKGLHVMIAAPGFTTSEIRKHALLEDGTEQGDSPHEEDHFMSAEKVARYILKGIHKKRRNMIISTEGKLTALFQRIIPRVVDRVYYKELAKEPNSPFK